MTLTIHLPQQSEETLLHAFGGDLDRVALEGISIEGYRTGKLSLGEVANVLGFETTIVALEWLGTRSVPLNYSADDYKEDQATFDRVFGAPGK
jgi:predicted HTH domain antitoxin